MRAPAPVDGDPATVRALAGTLAGQGDWLGSLGGSLRGLADPSLTTWDSAAGAAFGRRWAGVAGVVDRLSGRHAGGPGARGGSPGESRRRLWVAWWGRGRGVGRLVVMARFAGG